MDIDQLVKTAAAFDLSWSLTDQMDEQRALLGWWADQAPFDELQKAALNWGMSAAMVARWIADGQKADGVGITLNLDMSSLRLYTHSRSGTAPEKRGETAYRGYKSLADGSVRIDDYKNCGDLREPKNLAFARANSQQPQWLDTVLAGAPDDVPLMFVRIKNSGRNSWLATVRHADLDAGLFAGPDYNGRKLLHLAGGADATKGAFDSFYIASTPNEVSSFIHKANA
jgi:hypothetical protein